MIQIGPKIGATPFKRMSVLLPTILLYSSGPNFITYDIGEESTILTLFETILMVLCFGAERFYETDFQKQFSIYSV